MTRDIAVRSLTVSEGKVTCNGMNQVSMETVVVAGTSTALHVEVTNGKMRIVLENVNVNTASPLRISASSLTIITTGSKRHLLDGGGESRIQDGESSLFVTGGKNSAADKK
jgi:hypothetical protein